MTGVAIFLSVFLFSHAVNGQANTKIVTGAEQLDKLLPLLQNKSVALLVNNTSVIGQTHLVDTLQKLKANIKKIFSPEHGFRGKVEAGETIDNEIDAATGISVVSLYGNKKKPTPEHLADVDVVIFDIQDVGTRFFTYISSMHYLMEACAENKKKVIVLDRPNPNGHYIDGPVLNMSLKSFVGMHPIPIVHGLTVGELARMINGEGWLAGGITCDLEVVAMKNYDHQKKYSLLIKPSPNLPNDHAIALYPSTCLFEGTVMSLGRGTKNPFELLGNPLLKNQPFQFKPESIEGMAKNPPHENKICYGVDLRNEKPTNYISLKYLILFYNLYPDKDKFFIPYFNTLAGNTQLKEQIKKGMSEEDIRATWKKDLNEYKKKRKKYLLYN
ncbi:MAG: DUF1343 domain-containing protein [Bacteroidetes bacterium]|nr:DUF1343 domain-containing protein [Bacteroidota bacterium]